VSAAEQGPDDAPAERLPLLDRVRAAAREHVTRQQLTLPVGDGTIGVRYTAATLDYPEYVELRDRLIEPGPDQLVASLDFILRCCDQIVIRDDKMWIGLHEDGDVAATSPFLVGDPAALTTLEVQPARVLHKHVDDIEPGTARHNALALLTVYGASPVIGAEAEEHASELLLFAQGRVTGDRLPPA
jgi:hypothetical protein